MSAASIVREDIGELESVWIDRVERDGMTFESLPT